MAPLRSPGNLDLHAMPLAAHDPSETLLSPAFFLCGVLALGMLAQWMAWRMRVPALVLLLLFGFALGRFAKPEQYIEGGLLFPAVSLAVAVLLFEGGLSLRLREIRDTGRVVVRLVTAGLLVTWLGTALAAALLLDFSPQMAVLCGALLTVSGPTVIVPLLRHVRPVRRIGALIKWEGIVNDPIGAVLAALVFEVVSGSRSGYIAAHSLTGLGTTVLVGILLGASAAWTLMFLLKRYLVPDFLQNAAVLSIVLLVYVIANGLQHEAGLIAVTIIGVILANQRQVSVHHIVEFKENLRVLLISTLFIVLAARLQLDRAQLLEGTDWTAGELAWRGAAFLAVLLLLVRPVSVGVATIGSGLAWRERVLLAWVHPRGIVAAAVASLFALQLSSAPEARLLELITYVVIVGTVVVYGLTLAPLARFLGMASQDPQGVLFAGASRPVREIASALQKEGFYSVLVDSNHRNIAAARMAGLATVYANIGSEFAREETDLGDIGRLLAMTPNDQVNALAAMEFLQHFGRAGVYQLAPPDSASERQEPVAAHRLGRILFAQDITYEQLAKRVAAGAQVKTTSLTDDFTYEDFAQRYGEEALALFVVDGTKLKVVAVDDEPKPLAGQKLIALVPAT